MASDKKNFAVVGRIPFDDEDTCCIYLEVTQEEALERFERDMLAAQGETADGLRERLDLGPDDAIVYIIHVLECDSVIRRVWNTT